MLPNVLAIVTGFGIWVFANVLSAMVGAWIWGHSPDRYVSIATYCFLGSTVALFMAGGLKARIAPDFPARSFVLALGIIIVIWSMATMLSGVDVDIRGVALAAHATALVCALLQTSDAAPSTYQVRGEDRRRAPPSSPYGHEDRRTNIDRRR